MIYCFDEFTLDTDRYELQRQGESLHVEPQVYSVLCYLVENRNRVVTRDELLDHVWGHRFVTPATLNTRIKALRQALGDDGALQRMIRTVRGRGFRFISDVSIAGEAASHGASTRADTTAGAQHGAHDRPNGRIDATQQIRFCRAHDGARIAYATSGSGAPLVKPANWLTHLEFDWDSPVWRHWLTELGRAHTLIRYDERGCGLSDHDIEDFSFDAWVADLGAVVDAQKLDRFSLLGISQGCAVAVAYAALHPERVRSLVLYGGYACGRDKRVPVPQGHIEAVLLRNLIRVGWGRDNPAFRQVFGHLFVPDGTAEQFQWFDDLARTMPVENALRIEETAHGIDVREAAAALDVPTLVLHARGDAMVPFEEGRRLAALIPGARFASLDSRNHVLLEDEPAWATFRTEVAAFLQD